MKETCLENSKYWSAVYLNFWNRNSMENGFHIQLKCKDKFLKRQTRLLTLCKCRCEGSVLQEFLLHVLLSDIYWMSLFRICEILLLCAFYSLLTRISYIYSVSIYIFMFKFLLFLLGIKDCNSYFRSFSHSLITQDVSDRSYYCRLKHCTCTEYVFLSECKTIFSHPGELLQYIRKNWIGSV